MTNLKVGDKVVPISKTYGTHFDGNWQHLVIGEGEHEVLRISKYDLGRGNIDVVTIHPQDRYAGYYPAEFFVPVDEYKQSLIGDNIYEIY